MKIQLDDSASSLGDDYMDVDVLNEELSMFCEILLSKYKALISKSFELKEENKNLFSKLDIILQEKVDVTPHFSKYIKTES